MIHSDVVQVTSLSEEVVWLMRVRASALHPQVGSISGAVDALEAACRVCAPLTAGWLLEAVHVEGALRHGRAAMQ